MTSYYNYNSDAEYTSDQEHPMTQRQRETHFDKVWEEVQQYFIELKEEARFAGEPFYYDNLSDLEFFYEVTDFEPLYPDYEEEVEEKEKPTQKQNKVIVLRDIPNKNSRRYIKK